MIHHKDAKRALLSRADLLAELLRALGADRPPRLRRAVVYTMGRIAATEMRGSLAPLVGDPAGDVRLALVHVSGSI